MQFEIEKDFQFEAAHYFGHAGANDLFKKVHGHSFKGTVTITGNAQEDKGWVRDLWKIETIAAWIFDRLKDQLPGLSCVEVGRPSCGERARVRL